MNKRLGCGCQGIEKGIVSATKEIIKASTGGAPGKGVWGAARAFGEDISEIAGSQEVGEGSIICFGGTRAAIQRGVQNSIKVAPYKKTVSREFTAQVLHIG
jgi:hypothetical protein